MGQIIALIGVLLLAVGCGTPRCLPIESTNKTEVHYVDSIRIKDSTIVHTEVLVRDYVVAPDTLKMSGQHSQAMAWLSDSTIKGELTEEPWIEKVVYKDREIVRDSIQIVKKEIPVYVEVPVTPKWCWYLLIFFVIEILYFLLKLFVFFKK